MSEESLEQPHAYPETAACSAAADCWHHAEKIRCPKCGSIEDVAVAHTRPLWTYVHKCKCGYIILEQEWDHWRVDEPPNDEALP